MSEVYFWSHPQVPQKKPIESAIFGGLSAPHNKDEHLFLWQSHHHVWSHGTAPVASSWGILGSGVASECVALVPLLAIMIVIMTHRIHVSYIW